MIKAIPSRRPAGSSRVSPKTSRRRSGFLMASRGRGGVARAAGRPVISLEVSAAWDEQIGADDADLSPAELRYLFEHSVSIARSCVKPGSQCWGGRRLAGIQQLAFREEGELRASRSAAATDGQPHRGRARKHRAHLLDQRHDGHAQLHPLSAADLGTWRIISSRSMAPRRYRARRHHHRHLWRPAVVAGARSPRLGQMGLPPSRSVRQHRAADGGGATAAADCRWRSPVHALPPPSSGRRRNIDLRASSVEHGAGRRASRAAASRPCEAKLERGWGATVTKAMGIGDIAVSLWAKCRPRTACTLRPRLYPHRADRPRHRRLRPDGRRRPRLLVSTPHPPRSRPLLRLPQPRPISRSTRAPAPRRAALALHRRTGDLPIIVRSVNVSAACEVVNQFAPTSPAPSRSTHAKV